MAAGEQGYRRGLIAAVVTASLLGWAAPSQAAHGRHGGVAVYNGAWMVSSQGFCTGLESGQVTILNGRVIGPNGAGRVTPGGAVTTITSVNGVTTVGQGQITGGVASGTFRQSDGCVGAWTAVKL